jgi:ComF family protein
MIDTLLSIVAPHHCSGCGQIGTLLCDNCKYDIIDEHENVCIVCKKPASNRGVCAHCRVPYERAWTVGERSGSLQRLIGQYKFTYARAAYKPLSDLLDRTISQLPIGTIIVPVPTIASHVRERGYDHILLIAIRFAHIRGLKLHKSLKRSSQTTQRHTSANTRRQQAKRAFEVRGVIDPAATYLLIDDVATTGATLEFASKELKKAGAQHVWVAAIAYQTLD